MPSSRRLLSILSIGLSREKILLPVVKCLGGTTNRTEVGVAVVGGVGSMIITSRDLSINLYQFCTLVQRGVSESGLHRGVYRKDRVT